MTRGAPLLLFALSGCAPSSQGQAALDLSLRGDAGVAADLAPAVSGVRALIVDEGGAPLSGVAVAACTRKWCEYGKSARDGTVSIAIPDDDADLIVKSLEDETTMPARAESIAPIHVPGHVTVGAGTLFVPALPDAALLQSAASDPQTVDAGDGLVLTLRRADLDPPLGAIGNQIAARRIPLAHVPPLPGIDPKSLVAVYAIAPFSMTSRSKIGVRAPCTLPAGTALRIFTLSELDGTVSPAEPGKADGSFVETEAGAGIVDLTWVVIAR